MKKIYFFAGAFLLSSQIDAQVGIGLNNAAAQKALHVSGASTSTNIPGTGVNVVTPTVRIEGLNNTNQSITERLRPVSATSTGDLVLASLPVIPLVMIDAISPGNAETDYIANAAPVISIQTIVGSNNYPLRSFSFVLAHPSIVKFGAVTSFEFTTPVTLLPIVDNSSRIWGTKFRFTTAPAGISTAANAYFGESLQGYTNVVNNASTVGPYYSNSEDSLYLPAGSYTVEVSAYIDTQTSATPIRVANGLGSDTMSIVAYPAQ
ncbi:hypothetical protein [Chryseobacterium sp. Leaf180]|uniref:hypothetical protein n=1 Tax=Chryseobacterium sp. Leaf180 TaxID=1736289 RepID=UPI000AC96A6B|nr:hypothetical protein [Chryseobacterium sp. Leaf180]